MYLTVTIKLHCALLHISIVILQLHVITVLFFIPLTNLTPSTHQLTFPNSPFCKKLCLISFVCTGGEESAFVVECLCVCVCMCVVGRGYTEST
jgi:hypothetical protein